MSYAYVGHRPSLAGFRGLGVDSKALKSAAECAKQVGDADFSQEAFKDCATTIAAAQAGAACAAVSVEVGGALGPVCAEVAAWATDFVVGEVMPILNDIFGGLFGAGDAERAKARKALLKKIDNAEFKLSGAQDQIFSEWQNTVESLGFFYDKLIGGGGKKAAGARIKELGAEPKDWERMYTNAIEARQLVSFQLNPGLSAQNSYGVAKTKGTVNVFCKKGWAGINYGNYLKSGCAVDNDPLHHNATRKLNYINARLEDINAAFVRLKSAAAQFILETTGNAAKLKLQYRAAHPDYAASSDAAAAQQKARNDSAKSEAAKKDAPKPAMPKGATKEQIAATKAAKERRAAAARNTELLRMVFGGGTLGLLWRRRG